MFAVPDQICPQPVLQNAERAAPELLKALLVRSNFIPGVRHRLGWRGIKDCRLDTEAWTMRVYDRPGVFAVRLLEVLTEDGLSEGIFPLSYFPHPDEELVESFSVRAGQISQSPDYMDRVRHFLAHPEMRELFTVGAVRLAVDTQSRTCCLRMEAPGRSMITATQGIRIRHENELVELVPPGGTDQDLPAWNTALSFFRVLGATTSFCLRRGPYQVRSHVRPGRILGYDENGAFCSAQHQDEPEHSLQLYYGPGTWKPLERSLAAHDWREESQYAWNEGQHRPQELANEPWWDAHVPGERNSLDKNGLGIAERPVLLVVSGFLGAGKTSFLQRFIEYQAAHNQFVAVVQNEIGKQGLDGGLLGQQYAVTEVDEGCVCCSLVGSLKNAVHGLMQQFQPDCIVLETTGLANPANLLAEINELEDLVAFDSVTVLVDGANGLHCLEKYEVAREQVRAADILVLNKADLTTPEQNDELQARLRSLNSRAPLLSAEHGDVPPGLLYGVNLGRGHDDQEKRKQRGTGMHLPDLRTMIAPEYEMRRPDHSSDHMASAWIPLSGPVHRNVFEAVLQTLPASIFRLKGVVHFHDQEQPYVVQCVGGRCAVTPADKETDASKPFLVAIGTDAEAFMAGHPFAHCH